MDWLMGKARGVSRGFMSTNSPMSAPVSPECLPQSSGILTSGVPNANVIENGAKPITATKEITMTNGTDGRFSPPTYSQSSDNSASMKRRNSFKSNKSSPDSSEPSFLMSNNVQQLLPSCSTDQTDFHELVEPFPCMEQNEWLAAHTIALFDNISTIFDAIQELCTCSQLLPNENGSSTCTSWNFEAESILASNFDEERCKKQKNSSTSSNPTLGLARQELDTALSSCNDLIQSSKIFPVRHGDPFPSDLPSYVTLICKNLLICIIHIYRSHFSHLEQLELVAHMNTVAKHFFAFTTRFSLIEEKHFEPLMGFHKILLESP